MSQANLMGWILIALIIIAFLGWFIWQYLRIRRSAKFISNSQFQELMHNGQIIDVRSSTTFQRSHILGARNFQLQQFKDSLSALRKDKPVLLYDNFRGQSVGKVSLILKKAGFTEVYILEGGFENWDGKTK
ncbi:rhodanese-like domain-containing protein [Streptococcus dentapri]|uniref:Rhodanese-like domain-containing protein n=1 Tax=Streptococcus dentapri TaxID=573564 RepID=A0ABV8D2L9_9STRE